MRKLTAPYVVVGSSETTPDIAYETGFSSADPVVFIERGRERYLIVPRLEYRRAVRMVRGVEVFTPEMLDAKECGANSVSCWAIAMLRKLGLRRIAVSGEFPHGVAADMTRAGLTVLCQVEQTFRGHPVRSAEDMGRIADVQQAAVIAMRAAVEMIARSEVDERGFLRIRSERLTSEGVKRTIRHVLLDHDCFAGDIIVAGGEKSSDPHESGEGALRACEPVVIDIFPRHIAHQWWGDLTRTVVRGRAPGAVRRMYNAVRAAQLAALACVRPGVKAQTVHEAAEFELRRRTGEGVEADGSRWSSGGSTGHGVGLRLHEEPRLATSKERLRAGQVIAVEPGVYHPKIGCVRIEDTVVVTRQGWRFLAPCERRLEI
jgi:Xaa-Pro aminopeptidase